MENFLKEIKVLYEDGEFEVEKAGKIPEDAMKAITGALNILNKYKSDFPADVLDAIKTLGKYASYGYGYPAKKEKADDGEIDVEKIGAKLSKATLEELKKIQTILEGLIGTAEVIKMEKLPEDIRKKVEEYDRIKKEEQEKLKQADAAKIKTLEDKIKALEEENAKLKDELKTKKGIQKGIKGQDADKGDEKTILWPSLTSTEE
jgi:hypothetical protein